MKTLNLVDIDKSDIKYQIQKFPDGQQNIVINKFEFIHNIQSDLELILQESIQIKSKLNNFQDLELIICATKSLRNLGVKEIHLYTPYFLGSRSDRQFEEGSCNYLKDVICPIINSLKFESVTVVDPHSYVLEACLNNFKKIDNYDIVTFAMRDIIRSNKLDEKYEVSTELKDHFILVSPDAGASHKIYKLAEQIKYTGDIITCSKERDTDGKLTKCVVPKFDRNKDIIIIDDICDGGATFINIAKTIKEQNFPYGKIYLIVTHGIFSKGFSELSKYFNGIYCTNSYSEVLKGSFYNYDSKNIVKQLNIF